MIAVKIKMGVGMAFKWHIFTITTPLPHHASLHGTQIHFLNFQFSNLVKNLNFVKIQI